MANYIVAADQGTFQHIEMPRGRPQNVANLMRESLTSYFLTYRGSLPWQWQHARSTGPGLVTLNDDKLNCLLKVYHVAFENP